MAKYGFSAVNDRFSSKQGNDFLNNLAFTNLFVLSSNDRIYLRWSFVRLNEYFLESA
mgnify:CR=1 FL=1